MAAGPILIFDKSALQSLNPDEAVWLDNFFMSNITPLFFIETLADLEKEVRTGRTPEQVVGGIAYKTPDMQSRPNVHHSALLAGELLGAHTVDMRGVPAISGGQPVELGGRKGLIFCETPEEEAFNRWQRGEFLEVERMIAKAWRRGLTNVGFEEIAGRFKKMFVALGKPKTLQDVKRLADLLIDEKDPKAALTMGLALIGVAEDTQNEVLARWERTQSPIREFAPYFRHVYGVDLFFYLAMAADLISRERPSHKVDIAYLYYLPFCMVFTSNDRLHIATAPLFLGSNTSFVKASELKADLAKLDAHYTSLPEETKKRGLFAFASHPPLDSSFLVTQLWDKHLPSWRKQHEEPKEPLSKEAQEALLKLVRRFENDATRLDPGLHIPQEEVAQMTITRRVHARKGKWRRFPPEVESSSVNERRDGAVG